MTPQAWKGEWLRVLVFSYLLAFPKCTLTICHAFHRVFTTSSSTVHLSSMSKSFHFCPCFTTFTHYVAIVYVTCSNWRILILLHHFCCCHYLMSLQYLSGEGLSASDLLASLLVGQLYWSLKHPSSLPILDPSTDKQYGTSTDFSSL